MTATRFYVELPSRLNGSPSQSPLAVIEATLHPRGGPELRPCTNPGRPVLVIHAPAQRAASWRSPCYADSFRWAEVEGPARLLSHAEWEALVAQVGS